MAKCPFVNDTCNFLVSWCFDVCAWLDEASAPQHLVSLSNINRALWITLKDPEKLAIAEIQSGVRYLGQDARIHLYSCHWLICPYIPEETDVLGCH